MDSQRRGPGAEPGSLWSRRWPWLLAYACLTAVLYVLVHPLFLAGFPPAMRCQLLPLREPGIALVRCPPKIADEVIAAIGGKPLGALVHRPGGAPDEFVVRGDGMHFASANASGEWKPRPESWSPPQMLVLGVPPGWKVGPPLAQAGFTGDFRIAGAYGSGGGPSAP